MPDIVLPDDLNDGIEILRTHKKFALWDFLKAQCQLLFSKEVFESMWPKISAPSYYEKCIFIAKSEWERTKEFPKFFLVLSAIIILQDYNPFSASKMAVDFIDEITKNKDHKNVMKVVIPFVSMKSQDIPDYTQPLLEKLKFMFPEEAKTVAPIERPKSRIIGSETRNPNIISKSKLHTPEEYGYSNENINEPEDDAEIAECLLLLKNWHTSYAGVLRLAKYIKERPYINVSRQIEATVDKNVQYYIRIAIESLSQSDPELSAAASCILPEKQKEAQVKVIEQKMIGAISNATGSQARFDNKYGIQTVELTPKA